MAKDKVLGYLKSCMESHWLDINFPQSALCECFENEMGGGCSNPPIRALQMEKHRLYKLCEAILHKFSLTPSWESSYNLILKQRHKNYEILISPTTRFPLRYRLWIMLWVDWLLWCDGHERGDFPFKHDVLEVSNRKHFYGCDFNSKLQICF